MKSPDLEYNYYYPFYTQKVSGKKQNCYIIETAMHLSHSSAVRIQHVYHNKKTHNIEIEMINNSDRVNNLRVKCKHISYPDFAVEVEKAYLILSNALKKLSSSQAYSQYVYIYFKNNHSIHFELLSEHINIMFGKVADDIKAQRENKEIDNERFDKQLNKTWDLFCDYFKCPNVIKKTEYKPNSK